MKKILAFAVAAATLLPTYAAAAGNHSMAGCGLGYVLFGHDDNTRVMQVLAATTNGTSGNQTFGITSGTSGCTEDGAVKFVKEAELYSEVNFQELKRDMAVGSGEYANAFATLLGASEEAKPAVLKLFHEKYEILFPSAGTTPAQMREALGRELAAHPALLG